MLVKGHEVAIKKGEGGRVNLWLDGEFEGVFDTKELAIEYVEQLEDA